MSMVNVLVIGSGGREHAIVSSFLKSNSVGKVYAAPANAGMLSYYSRISSQLKAEFSVLSFQSLQDIYDIVVEKKIDLVFVGPEQYLEEGIADYLEDKGVAVVAPGKKASQLESSKVFAKDLMSRYGIPTAEYRTFCEIEDARTHLNEIRYPTVIKADGLAAGKGVIIANNKSEADDALVQMMQDKVFGDACNNIVIEEFLEGWEASIFAITDGDDYKLTIVSQDHKKLLEGNKGPNTGGMGAYAPVDKADPYLEVIDETIFNPLFQALKKENIRYKGILYAGLIFTKTGPHVLEFNCRLGDPETQVILPLLENDIMDVCLAITENKVSELQLKWLPGYAVNIVAASKGYPGSYQKGKTIKVEEEIYNDPKTMIFYAGVASGKNCYGQYEKLVTSGGRVLSITAFAESLPKAVVKAYDVIRLVDFEGMFYRKDIAKDI